MWTFPYCCSEKCFEIIMYEVLESCRRHRFQMSRTFLFEKGTIFLTCCLKAGMMLAKLLTCLRWKITSNTKRTNKCLDEVGSKYIQQCYYYEEISFFGEKKNLLSTTSAEAPFLRHSAQGVLQSLQGCGLFSKLIQVMLTTCLAQQYVVKYVLIKKKTLSGLAQILLAL